MSLQNLSIIKYRPEIDGLRAVAVLAVVLYHAKIIFINNSVLFKGGFIGVDIFFVISGYLITSILLVEMGKNDFSFSWFYERRARRILPALLTVMLVSIPLAWIFILPVELKKYAGSCISALLASSNIWFLNEDSYTAEVSNLKPFLHTWSLSVEEQFYFLFPLMLIFMWKWKKNYISTILMLLIFASVFMANFASTYHTGAYKNAAFYLLPSRVFELAAGAILAKIESKMDRNNDAILASIMTTVGFCLIVYSLVFFNDQMNHPSYYTLLPVLGVMLIIWYGKENDLVSDLLGSKIFVGIGLISYSLYLWHAPLFAFAHIKYGNLTNTDKLLLIIGSIILSIFTYKYIEKPARNRQLLSRKSFLFMILPIFFATILIFSYFYLSDGVQYRYPVNFYYPYEKEWRSGKCFLGPEQIDRGHNYTQCKLIENLNNEKPLLYIWGDSTAAHLYPGLKHHLSNSFNILQRTASSCPPVKDRWRGAHQPQCNDLNDLVLREIEENKPAFVILAGAWNTYEEGIDPSSLIAQLKKIDNVKIILAGPPVNWGSSLPKRILEATAKNFDVVPTALDAHYSEKIKKIEDNFRKLEDDNTVYYFSIRDALCANNTCTAIIGRDPIAWDVHHLTTAGSILVVEQLLQLSPIDKTSISKN